MGAMVSCRFARYRQRMRIGEVARQAGVSDKTVRFYEQIGLIDPPVREANGYRAYDAAVVDRLAFIKDSQAAGLSLAEIGEILAMKSEGQSTCAHTVDVLERHLAEVTAQIAKLQSTKAELEGMLGRAKVLDPGCCTATERCQVIPLDLPVQVKV